MRLLVVANARDHGSPEAHRTIAFGMYERELRERLGLEVTQVLAETLEEVEAAVGAHPADVAAIALKWDVEPEAAIAALGRMRALPNALRLVLLDCSDPVGSTHFGLLPHVDCYVKPHRLRDDSQYGRDFAGGLPFTDYLVRETGYDLNGWRLGDKPDLAYMDRMVTGWNLGVSPRYRRRLGVARRFRALWRLRPVAVHRRFAPARIEGRPREWYEEHRERAARALDPLEARWRVTGSGRTRYRYYLMELMASRIVVSPFGWGEVCFRDFECVVTGGLLVKPNMDHLTTRPDIYKAGETYVPVRWDFSDVVDACEYYLNHPAEAMRIVANAQDALRDYYDGEGFVADVREMMAVALRGGRGPAVEEAGDVVTNGA